MSFIQKPHRHPSPKPVKGVTLKLEDLIKQGPIIPKFEPNQIFNKSAGYKSPIKHNTRPQLNFATPKPGFSSPESKLRSKSAVKDKNILNQSQPIRLQLNLQDILRTPSPMNLSRSIQKVKLNFASDFLEPEEDTQIPSYKDYMSRTPNRSHTEKRVSDFLQAKQRLIAKTSISDTNKFAKEIQDRYNVQNVVLVPRVQKKRLPSSILVCDGDEIQVFDVQKSD